MTPDPTIGIISPGDMGHSVGQVLNDHGLRVITCLAGRSERTHRLAAEAGIEDLPDYATLVREADLLLSILVPAQALTLAGQIVEAIHETGAMPVYVDCNAIAPGTVREIASLIGGAGAPFIDASIIGPPPRGQGRTRIYTSGPNLDPFLALRDYGLDIRPIGEEIGQASALKMCYSTSTKGLTALYAELLTAAHALGVLDALFEEFAISQPEAAARMQRGVPRVPRKARRFVGEMEEIARTFEAVGLTPDMLAGAAEMYRLIGATEYADVSPEDPTPAPELEDLLTVLTGRLARPAP